MFQTTTTAAEIPLAVAAPTGIDHEEHGWAFFLSVMAGWADAAFFFLLLLLFMFFFRGLVAWVYGKLPLAWIDTFRDFYDGPRNWMDMKEHWAGRSALRYKRDREREEQRQKKKDKKEEKKKQKRRLRTSSPDLESGYALVDYPPSQRRRLGLEES